jgi:DNA (cytosine-5)-methyltransferase 1
MVGVSRSLKFQWERATPWAEQIRSSIKKSWTAPAKRGLQSELVGASLWDSLGVDEPLGIKSGNRIVRERRSALGNCLDPRVAAIALSRVLYLNSLL